MKSEEFAKEVNKKCHYDWPSHPNFTFCGLQAAFGTLTRVKSKVTCKKCIQKLVEDGYVIRKIKI